MKVILYVTSEHAHGIGLRNTLEQVIPKHLLAVFNMVTALSQGLRGPLPDTILVLCPAGREEVQELAVLKELIRDVRTILILPNSDRETLAIGHQFQPRFITVPTPGFKDVSKVLAKMLHLKN